MKKYFFTNKLLFFTTVLIGVLASCSVTATALILNEFTNVISDGNIDKLINVFIFSVLYYLVSALVYFLSKINQSNLIKRISASLKIDIFNGLLNSSIEKFNRKNSADYISILINDIKILEESYFQSILKVISNAALATCAIIMFIFINPVVAIIAIIADLIPIIFPYIFNKKLLYLKNKYSDTLSAYTQRLKDFTEGFEVIKSFNIESFIKSSHKKSVCKSEDSRYSYNFTESISFSVTHFYSFFMFMFIFAVSGYFVIRKNLRFGNLLAMIQLLNYIADPITSCIEELTKIKSTKDIRNKIIEIKDTPQESDGNISLSKFNHTIDFNNVSFSYSPQKQTLKNITFSIKKGEKCAIVGTSGSGKSTLLKLLRGYYKNYSGNIQIDGIDLKDISVKNLNNLISIIHQNVFMFEDTILNNICLYNQYNDENISKAISNSGLTEVIDNLDDGINTMVEENGKNFSGGEKQRICIARSLVKETPILILDEGTSNLDNETSFLIENTVLNIKSLTTIVVTHKLSETLLKKYDKIIVIKDGILCEEGNFDTLMNNKKEFYSLYTILN